VKVAEPKLAGSMKAADVKVAVRTVQLPRSNPMRAAGEVEVDPEGRDRVVVFATRVRVCGDQALGGKAHLPFLIHGQPPSRTGALSEPS